MVTMLGLIALMAVISHLSPRLVNQDIFFGVTVAPGFRDEPIARRVALRYAIEVWLLALASAALVAMSSDPLRNLPVVAVQGLGAAVAFAKARHTVTPYAVVPTSVREAEVGGQRSLPGGVIGQLGPFLILFAVAIYLGVHWHEVPARFPMHWNLAGRPNGWTHKSLAGVFGPLWMGLVGCCFAWAISYLVVHRTRLPLVTGEGGREASRARRINLTLTLAGEYLVAILLTWTSVVAMFSPDPDHMRLPLAIRVAPFALSLLGALALTRARAMRRLAAGSAPVGDATPDSKWILGLLYVNRADPAVFVERRMGLGYTANLGNIWVWLLTLSTIAALLLPALVGNYEAQWMR